jgi:hypothetical protein
VCVSTDVAFAVLLAASVFNRHGHVFSGGGGSDPLLGGRGIYPPAKNISPVASKIKRSSASAKSFFYDAEKIAKSPQPVFVGGMEVLGGGRYKPPIPPTPMSVLVYPFSFKKFTFKNVNKTNQNTANFREIE